MTIITKPLSEKKEAKPLTPIVPESPSAVSENTHFITVVLRCNSPIMHTVL